MAGRALHAVFIVLIFCGIAGADVDWHVQRTLDIGEEPVDIAATPDGKLTFVLTGRGHILIYAEDGSLRDDISVGKSVEKIEVLHGGDRLLLLNGKDKTLQVVTLEFIHEIDIEGSPFRGPYEAPIAIAVFSDFQ